MRLRAGRPGNPSRRAVPFCTCAFGRVVGIATLALAQTGSCAGCHDGAMRLDEEKLEALRSWAERLQKAGDEESTAVGRAILMLIEEIDRLHIDLWHARMDQTGKELASEDEAAESAEQPVASSLHARLHRLLGGDAGSAAQPADELGSDTETDASTSAQDWIAALRRQR